jgi:His-Xaa-Ser system protein HxsD
MDLLNRIENNKIIVFVSSDFYSKDSVAKCLYWYGGRFRVFLSIVDSCFYRIELESKEEVQLDPEKAHLLMVKLEQDLLDFNLRDIVTKETRNIRDILTAKAFSNGEFDEIPPGQISDPVGFEIKGLQNEGDSTGEKN